MQMVRAGLKAIYLSGWQVAADANTASAMYPDQSLYPANAAPELAKRINRTLQRADQIEPAEGNGLRSTPGSRRSSPTRKPVSAAAQRLRDHEGVHRGGCAGVHFEDQLASEKKCGHLGGKVLIPTAAHIRNLDAARLAADVMGVPTLVVARTDAEAAKLLTSDIDERDQPFVDKDKGRTVEGFYQVKNGIEPCIARAIAYAPHCDLIWMETGKPDLEQARRFAEAVHKAHPGKLLAYNCSPSFNWKKNLDDATIAKFQRELGAMGYKFQFITLAGFHQLNFGMFELARGYKERQMAAYSELQEAEFAAEINGYTATKHQREVGTGYFDAVSMAITGGQSSTTAMKESTEHEQFRPAAE
jgi:isocitrate lyase